MRVTFDLKPEVYQFYESRASSLGKTIGEYISELLNANDEEVQSEKEELDEL